MEGAAGVAAVRGGSLPMPSPSSQSARKEWRAVSEHSVRSASSEDLERSKLGQSDERTIYEQGTGQLNVDYCSITIDGSLDNDLLQQRLHSISRQREELQHVEVELRAQVIARSEIMALRNSFDARINEHANSLANLKEQLHEREEDIHELELKIEEKDRELRAAKIDNEAAWAKEDLLREQNKELASFRRERDNSEAERGQNLKQIHDLKEHIQEKERQYLELEEQHRVAQEAILYRDEQLREAQAWIARVQEMEALQQAELRDRVEQFNQFWLGCQRQFADMERHHLQTVQQLQMELSESRERSGIYTDESATNRVSPKEASTFELNKVPQSHMTEDGVVNVGVMPNGNAEDSLSYSSAGNVSKTDRVSEVPVAPSSLYGVGAYASPGQVTALHPFVLHQQGVSPSVPSPNLHVPQTHVGQFQSMAAMQTHPHWEHQQHQQNQQQQVVSDGSQNHYQVPQTGQTHLGEHGQYDFDLPANGHILQPNHLDSNISQDPSSVVKVSADEPQVLQQTDRNDVVTHQIQQDFHADPQFPEAFQLVSPGPNIVTKVPNEDLVVATNHTLDGQTLDTEQRPTGDITARSVNTDANETNPSVVSSESLISTGSTANLLPVRKVPEPALLDERSLLACIVRAIPAGSGGQIRISSTLPNRLGKMLAPLHWHDYKKKYGKLDDFVAGHPQLFVIDGDFIHLRDGAQEIISATAAVAKVAAAAAASAPYASSLPSVAVTPMAQSHRLKKVSVDSKAGKNGSAELSGAPTSRDEVIKLAHSSVAQSQQLNGLPFITHGLSNVKILSKPKAPQELNRMHSGIRPDQSSVHKNVGNGANPNAASLSNSQMKGSSNGRPDTNFGGKQQGRTAGAALMSRK